MWFLLGVKAWQVTEAAEALRSMIGPEMMVVPLQNGVEAPSQLAAQLGAGHTLAGLCGTFSWVTAPGRIRSIGASHFIKFGELDNRPSERIAVVIPISTQALPDAAAESDLYGRDARQAAGRAGGAAEGPGDRRQGSAGTTAMVETA